MPRPGEFVLTLSCRDTRGIVHAVGPDDYAAVGRDVESVVLARAVRWHVEHRVLMNGRKTVVFP
jgi:formyltetrahydrofolate deformylase